MSAKLAPITGLGASNTYPNNPGGFSFENVRRNEAFTSNPSIAHKLPKFLKTGTTICGALFDGGVVLGADTRSTSDLVIEKNCDKIHFLAPNIFCCGAGTAADTYYTCNLISSQLRLLRLNEQTTSKILTSRVATALTLLKRHLFKYQGNVSAALVLGGVDSHGFHLHTVAPHGSVDRLPFVSMGSGCVAAMSVLETQYKEKMTRNECIKLVENAIRAGVFNDLGSGSNVDYLVIENVVEGGKNKVKVDRFRGSEVKEGQDEIAIKVREENDVERLKKNIKVPKFYAAFPKGTTIVTKETVEYFNK